MFSIIESGSKQYKIAKGDKIEVELLHKKDGSKVTFKPLFIWDGKKASIGKPYVSGKSVEGKVVQAELRGPKIRIVKQKPKKRYRRVQGHRQRHTMVEITKI
ncbi:50S ribosomal protein L21 [Patescibacteria group bacterium]